MPTIAKTKTTPKKNLFNEQSRAERQQIYQSDKWKKLRLAKLIEQPLCEICLAKGLVVPAIDVHHIDSFTNYTGANRLWKAYDFDNLQSLCKECHSKIHLHTRI